MTSDIKPIDHTYFHVSNGGLEFNIDEVTPLTPSGQRGPNRHYAITTETSLFGLGQSSSFPIYSTAMCDALIAALMRTRTHMGETGYASTTMFMSDSSTDYEGGYRIAQRWTEETETSLGSSKRELLGHEFWDGETLHKFVPWTGEPVVRETCGNIEEYLGDDETIPPPWTARVLARLRGLIGRA